MGQVRRGRCPHLPEARSAELELPFGCASRTASPITLHIEHVISKTRRSSAGREIRRAERWNLDSSLAVDSVAREVLFLPTSRASRDSPGDLVSCRAANQHLWNAVIIHPRQRMTMSICAWLSMCSFAAECRVTFFSSLPSLQLSSVHDDVPHGALRNKAVQIVPWPCTQVLYSAS